jgi:hypothetical protein
MTVELIFYLFIYLFNHVELILRCVTAVGLEIMGDNP